MDLKSEHNIWYPFDLLFYKCLFSTDKKSQSMLTIIYVILNKLYGNNNNSEGSLPCALRQALSFHFRV